MALAVVLGLVSTLFASPAWAGYDDPSPARWRNFLNNPSFESCSWFGCSGSTASWTPVNAGAAVTLRTDGAGGGRYGSPIAPGVQRGLDCSMTRRCLPIFGVRLAAA